jgi:3-hydroxyisobutyrate dehydrogenase
LDGASASARGLVTAPLVVQTSTIGPDATARLAEQVPGLIDAPVLGTKAPAEEGKLIVLASGPEDARERVDPLFAAIGAKTLWLGEAGAGSRLKLVINTWLLALTEAWRRRSRWPRRSTSTRRRSSTRSTAARWARPTRT